MSDQTPEDIEHEFVTPNESLPFSMICRKCGAKNSPFWESVEPTPKCEPDKYRMGWSISMGRVSAWREPIKND